MGSRPRRRMASISIHLLVTAATSLVALTDSAVTVRSVKKEIVEGGPTISQDNATIIANSSIEAPAVVTMSTVSPPAVMTSTKLSPKLSKATTKSIIHTTLKPRSHTPKPIEESHTVVFLTVFVVGFVGVIGFYIWKKSSGRWSFGEGRYQYSVLNTNTHLTDQDDDSNDPLMADIGRDEADMGDNSFLDIRNYQYNDDDDVELLGADSGDFLVNLEAPNLTVVTTRSQVGNVSTGTNNIGSKISADLLEDSDEELLK